MKLLEGENVHRALDGTWRTRSSSQDNVQSRPLTNVMFRRLADEVKAFLCQFASFPPLDQVQSKQADSFARDVTRPCFSFRFNSEHAL